MDAAVDTANSAGFSANDLLAAAVFSGKQAASAQNPLTPAIDPAKDNALLAAQTAAMEGESLDLGPDARLSWRIGEANASGGSNQAPAASTLSSGLFGLNGVRPMPAPGVYARHNAVDTPALLPDGSVSEISVPGPLRARGDLRPVDTAAVAETEALASGRAALGPADHPVADDPGTSPGEPR